MTSQPLVTAESSLAGKFTGTFTSDGGQGNSVCELYRTGRVKMISDLDLDSGKVQFITSGSWYMDENQELVITIIDEKDSNVTYHAKLKKNKNNLPLIIGLAAGGAALVGGGVLAFFLVRRKKKIPGGK